MSAQHVQAAERVYVCGFVEPRLRSGLDQLAEKNHRTRSGELRVALERHLSREQREAATTARSHP